MTGVTEFHVGIAVEAQSGWTLAANASAASLRAFMNALRAAASRGPPSLTPRRLAAAKAALVLSLIAPPLVLGDGGEDVDGDPVGASAAAKKGRPASGGLSSSLG